MQALFVFRRERRRFHVLPVRAIKCFAISLAIVIAALFVMDRMILPIMERRGLTSGDDWARHNAVVVREHQLADRTVAFPEPKPPLIPAGVRSWEGNLVQSEKANGVKRILVMGDSFVWGSAYLTLNHMWWRQLGQILEPNSVEVIAIGRPGASTRDQLRWATYFAPRYKPDLIIWGYVTNDADEGLVRQIAVSQQSIPKLDRVRHLARKLWPRMMAKFDALRSTKLATMYTGEKYGYEYSEWELKLVEPENLKAYARTVAEVKSFMDDYRGFMMTLPNFPSTVRFDPRNIPAVQLWKSVGIPAFDTTPEFVKRYGETSLSGTESIQWGINPADGHPGPRACRFLAEQAADIIRRDYPDILNPVANGSPHIRVNDWLPATDQGSLPPFDPRDPSWTLESSNDESRWPTMPLGIPTPLFAFEQPVRLSSIELTGTELRSGRLWLSFLDTNENYDDGIPHDLGAQRGTHLVWTIPPELAARPVSVVRYRAEFSGHDRKLVWKFPSRATVSE